MIKSNKQDIQSSFETLKQVGELICETFGDLVEVVLHDLSHPDNSIIWICGNITGRKIGGPITDLGLAALSSGDYSAKYCYTTYTEDGKVLKSSTMILCDDNGEPYGSFCVNFDISSLLAFDGALKTLVTRNETVDIQENFTADVSDTLNLLLTKTAVEIGKPIEFMNLSDRSELIKILDEKGAFQLKKAVPFIAGKLGVSRQTIYNYLKQVK
ncbi:MAG: PAS domain-containing protein [Anaerolineales bacterium]|nr:PAS domain-containing protein [Anaerolineales bacterium]